MVKWQKGIPRDVNILFHGEIARLPGGGGTQKRFIPFCLPFFSEKAPLSNTFYWKKAPLSYTFLRRLMNKSLKQEVFLSFFDVARSKSK